MEHKHVRAQWISQFASTRAKWLAEVAGRAARKNHVHVLKLLLETYHCSFTETDSHGFTPAGVSAYSGSHEALEWLTTEGGVNIGHAGAIRLKQSQSPGGSHRLTRETPLQLAEARQNSRTAQLIHFLVSEAEERAALMLQAAWKASRARKRDTHAKDPRLGWVGTSFTASAHLSPTKARQGLAASLMAGNEGRTAADVGGAGEFCPSPRVLLLSVRLHLLIFRVCPFFWCRCMGAGCFG